jgi:tetratricopeptide (TPR) repeat protein
MRRGLHSLVALLLLAASAPFAAAHPSDAERIDLLTRRIEASPSDPRLYVERGAAYTHDGRYELALADFRKAEQLGEPALVAYELGVLHERRGELRVALGYADAYLARLPQSAPALELRARLLAKLGETAAAVAALERLLLVQARPNPGSYVSLARLLASPGGAGVESALAALDRGMVRLGVIPQLQRVAIELELARGGSVHGVVRARTSGAPVAGAELELARGDAAGALARLESLGPVLGEGPEWKVEKCEILIRMGRADEARPLLALASSQLAGLRATPARRGLAERIERIEAELAARPRE